MQLNYEFTASESNNKKGVLVLIHGLFGSLSNLGMLARAFQTDYDIVQIDLRNHGASTHADDMSYAVMAQDVIDTLNHLEIKQFSVIGHSMGGKVAMKLTELAQDRLQHLIVLDMAPVAYSQRHHDAILEALFAVVEADVSSRQQATEIMLQFIKENGLIQFLLKSFYQGHWKFNLDGLYKNYANIINWSEITPWSKPTLFIRGENSEYLAQESYINAIHQQFANADIKAVKDAGHWLHAEKTEQVIQLIRDCVDSKYQS